VSGFTLHDDDGLIAWRKPPNAHRFFVLDRPNPLGGEIVEGPMLDAGQNEFRRIFPLRCVTASRLASSPSFSTPRITSAPIPCHRHEKLASQLFL